jgi:hypothetical protein
MTLRTSDTLVEEPPLCVRGWGCCSPEEDDSGSKEFSSGKDISERNWTTVLLVSAESGITGPFSPEASVSERGKLDWAPVNRV